MTTQNKMLEKNTQRPEIRRSLEDEVVGMKLSINACKGVSKTSLLPNNILAMIFQEYRHLMARIDPYYPYRWVRITHVCHPWRELALRIAGLWSTFVVGKSEITREFLRRSKSTPLTIKVPSCIQDTSICDTLDVFVRIRDIELNTGYQDYLSVRSRFPKEAPILRRIVIRCQETFDQRSIIQGREYVTEKFIPAVFDRCSLPSLITLSIEGFMPQWQNHIFSPTITSLTVHSISKDNYGTGNVLDALEKMKNLVLLDLTFNCASMDWLSPETRRVSLPKLEHLALCDSVGSCAYLLERIDYPPTTTIAVALPRHRPLASLSTLSPITFSKLSAQGVPEILTVTLRFDKRDFSTRPLVYLAFWDQVLDTEDIPSDHVKPLFHLQSASMSFAEMLQHGVSLGPFSQTQVLYIGGAIDYNEDPWEEVKESMPNVHTLHVAQPDPEVWERLLSRDILHKSKRTSQTKPFFPHLRKLILEEANFESLIEGPWGEGLNARKLSGRPIHTIRLFDCRYLITDAVEVLQEFVEVVDWDGYEEFCRSPHDWFAWARGGEMFFSSSEEEDDEKEDDGEEKEDDNEGEEDEGDEDEHEE